MAEAILVADDESGVRDSLAEVLRDAGYVVETAVDGTAALEAIDGHDFSLVITDLQMPGADGLAVLRKLHDVAPQTVPLVMTAHGSIESAVEALRGGAADYILKPVVFDDVLAKVARILEHRQLAWQTQMLRREVERDLDFDHLVGKSGLMHEVFHLVRKVAPTLRDRREDIPGLIEFLVRRHNREMKRSYRGVDNATLKLLVAQPWRGNVRELDYVIEHAMILGDGQ